MAPHIENTTQYKKLITPVYSEAFKYNKSHICVNKLLKNSDFYVFFTTQEWIIYPFSPNAPSTNYQSLADSARDHAEPHQIIVLLWAVIILQKFSYTTLQ